jgi:hypothetical protein
MSASTRTAQQPLGIQFGAILAIVALAIAVAFAIGIGALGAAKPAGAPAGPAVTSVDHHDLPDVNSGTGAAVQPDGTWVSNGRGGVEFVPKPALRRTFNGPRTSGPDDGAAPVIHGPRVAPE